MGMGMHHHLCNTRRESYYAVLGVLPDASAGEIRNAYRKLAMKWHPDRWQRQPRLVDEANRRFQLIQEAYQVLSDRSKRTLYDAGLYEPLQDDGEEAEVEGFSDFLQEMLTLMANVRREKQQYSLQELQRMLGDMARSFDSPPAPAPATCWSEAAGGSSRGSKRFRSETEPASAFRTKLRVHGSGMGVFGSCC